MTKTPDKRVESTLWKLRAPSAPHAGNVRLAMATEVQTRFPIFSRIHVAWVPGKDIEFFDWRPLRPDLGRNTQGKR